MQTWCLFSPFSTIGTHWNTYIYDWVYQDPQIRPIQTAAVWKRVLATNVQPNALQIRMWCLFYDYKPQEVHGHIYIYACVSLFPVFIQDCGWKSFFTTTFKVILNVD